MHRRWVIGTTLAVMAVMGLGLGFKSKWGAAAGPSASQAGQAAEAADAPLLLSALDVAQAGPATIEQALPIAGTVEAGRSAVLRSRHAGILVGLNKRPGDRVRAGEVLARIDSEDLRQRLGEREAALRQAQAALSVADSVRQQQRRLAEQGFISKTALDNAENNWVAARTALETAQAQWTIAKTAMAETSLTAPVTGVIARRMVEPSERVGPEASVLQIVDLSSLEIAVAVPAERAAALRPGMQAVFRPDSTAREAIEAQLTRIVPTAVPGARTVEARFSLGADSGIPVGAFLSGRLILTRTEVPVAIPRSALRTDAGGHYVWVIRTGRVERLRLDAVALESEGAQVAIPSGLAAGTYVLVLRGSEPRVGQPVQWPGSRSPVAATPGS